MIWIILSIIFTIFYVLIANSVNIIFRLSNAFFLLGVFFTCLALLCYVRNVGFFKSLSYFSFKREKNKLEEAGYYDDVNNVGSASDSHLDSSMDFADYVNTKYSKKWDNAIFFKLGIPLLMASLILALI